MKNIPSWISKKKKKKKYLIKNFLPPKCEYIAAKLTLVSTMNHCLWDIDCPRKSYSVHQTEIFKTVLKLEVYVKAEAQPHEIYYSKYYTTTKKKTAPWERWLINMAFDISFKAGVKNLGDIMFPLLYVNNIWTDKTQLSC